MMTSTLLMNTALSFSSLTGTRYSIHLGRSGKLATFDITIDKEDFHHLIGLHYLTDVPDRRNRSHIFDDILSSEPYRVKLAHSELWTDHLKIRVMLVNSLKRILDDNSTIFRYNPRRLHFYSHIKAEYLLSYTDFPLDETNHSANIFLFLDKRDNLEERFCKSIFLKDNRDFTHNQSVWTLLYKEKYMPDGTSTILYQHKNYDPKQPEQDRL